MPWPRFIVETTPADMPSTPVPSTSSPPTSPKTITTAASNTKSNPSLNIPFLQCRGAHRRSYIYFRPLLIPFPTVAKSGYFNPLLATVLYIRQARHYCSCNLKFTGIVKYERTGMPPFFPGAHFGIMLTTRRASLSRSLSTLLIT